MGRPRDLEARDRILSAAYDLITTEGADASINAIVSRAGVGKATVYRWWTSRTAVVLDAFARVEERAGTPTMPDDPLEAIRTELVRTAELWLGDGQAIVGDLLAALLRGEDEAEEIQGVVLGRRRDRLRKQVGRAAENGHFRDDVDLDRATDALLAPLLLQVVRGEHRDPDALVGQILEVAVSGMAAG